MCHRLSLAVVSCSRLLGPGGALLQHQHRFAVLLQPHRVGFHILNAEHRAHTSRGRRPQTAAGSNHRGPANSTRPMLRRHTLRMRMKSCLSTRRKWQLSSLRMMVAARGASFSKASCPKSSPSCKVVTSPCSYARFHVRLAPNSNVKSYFKNIFF